MEEQTKQPFDLLPGIDSRIIAGIISFTGIMILLAWVAINEEARMEEFTERFQGRSIETGGLLFENNCSECHGQMGYGIDGIAPALNNPQLFGFSFFADLDLQIAAKEAELADLGDDNPERAAQLEQEIAGLQAERQVLEEKLLYDYAAQLDEYRAQLDAVNAQILAMPMVRDEFRITNIAVFGVKVAELQRQKQALEAQADVIQARVNAAQTQGTEPDPNDETRLEELDTQLARLDEQLAVLEPLNALRVNLIGKVARFTALQDAHLKVLDLREQIAQKESELAVLPAAPPVEDPAGEQRTSLTAEVATLEEQLAEKQAELDALPPAPTETGVEDPDAEQRRTLTAEVTTLQEQLAEKQAELDALPPAPAVEDPNAEQRTALLDEITALKEQLARAQIERDNARNLLIVEKDIVAYDPERVGRMEELKWNGALRDLIRSTIASGRPTSGSYWPRQMPAWSQRAGGPLRDDQIENLVDYILNWQTEFTFESTRHVLQYAIIPAAGTPAIANAVGDDPNRIVLELADLEAAAAEGFDSVAGQQSFQSLGCAGCHQVGGTGAGPDLTGVATRAGQHPEYASARAYLVTSIVNPGDFIVAGYSDGIMPADFGKRLDLPTLSNLIAYLESQD